MIEIFNLFCLFRSSRVTLVKYASADIFRLFRARDDLPYIPLTRSLTAAQLPARSRTNRSDSISNHFTSVECTRDIKMAAEPARQDKFAYNYDLSKADYMAKIKKCFDEDSTHSETVIRKTIEILKGPVKTHLHKNYEVSNAFGREILIKKSKSPADPKVQVLTFEDVFDVFIKYHIGNNHNGGHHHLLDVEKNLNCSFNYPTICLSILVMTCNVCKSRSRKSKKLNKISSVYVTVMIQRRKLPDFRYILIYIDRATNFVIIRSLRQKSDMEVSMEIFKIMTQFGPPQKLCLHGYNRQLNQRIGVILRQACHMFSFSIEYRSACFDPSAYVISKLQEWMVKNASMSWEIGCSVVQNDLNKELKQKIHSEKFMDLSPYELFYGKIYPARGMKSKTRKGVAAQWNYPDDDAVELRIPKPGGGQEEDSSGIYIVKTGKKLTIRAKIEKRKQNLRLPNLKTDDALHIDMECEDYNPEGKLDKSPVIERSTEKVVTEISSDEDEDIGELTEYGMEEDLIYNPDEVDLDNAVDPLDVE